MTQDAAGLAKSLEAVPFIYKVVQRAHKQQRVTGVSLCRQGAGVRGLSVVWNGLMVYGVLNCRRG